MPVKLCVTLILKRGNYETEVRMLGKYLVLFETKRFSRSKNN